MTTGIDQLELLAPAGKWEVMVAVAGAGADAVYLGGKRFNMRLLRPDFNFDDNELIRAADYLHERGKRLYVTVNNLFLEKELDALADYLAFLDSIRVDGVIVQDLATASIVRSLGLRLPLHASVQMGIASHEALKSLERLGFTRAVLSKNATREEVAAMHAASPLELEYFVHGDLCVAHTGQCYMSSFFFGDSGNRGACHKPCRWKYRLTGDSGGAGEEGYYLAYKDLCLLGHLPEMARAGIMSFKIEGRMRDAGYLSLLTSVYREALDRVIAGGEYRWEDLMVQLHEKRIRDFTTSGFVGRGTRSDIGSGGEREPRFPTSPVAVPGMTESEGKKRQEQSQGVLLQVRTLDKEAAREALSGGARTIILPVDQRQSWDIAEMEGICSEAGAVLVWEMPRIVAEGDLPGVKDLLAALKDKGGRVILAMDLGSLAAAKEMGFAVWGGYGLNVTNSGAVSALAGLGAERLTASLEMDRRELLPLLEESPLPVDVVVHGPLPGMVTDVCLRSFADTCVLECQDDICLVDEYGQQYPLACDSRCRTTVYFPRELALLSHVQEMAGHGARGFILNLAGYSPEEAGLIVRSYRSALAGDMTPASRERVFSLPRLFTDVTYTRGMDAPSSEH